MGHQTVQGVVAIITRDWGYMQTKCLQTKLKFCFFLYAKERPINVLVADCRFDFP